VLIGIDDVDWAALDGAYGPCTEAPGILRGLASSDPDVAAEAVFEFASSIWHQGTVYPVTAEVVPFLIELAVTDGVHRRAGLLRTLGALCDPDLTSGGQQWMVRAAVAVHSGPLLPLLDDPDPEIRLHAAYAAAWSGPHAYDTLRRRWETETHPAVRASVLSGLAHLEPAATAPLVEAALHDPSPGMRTAAATTLARSGRPIPPGALEPVGEAFAVAGDDDSPWAGFRPAWETVFAAAGPEDAAALAAPMARAAAPGARSRLLHAIGRRFGHSRSSVPVLLPLVGQLLADPEAEVRSDAAAAALAAGEAAAVLLDDDRAADGLLGVARSGDRCALRLLVRLGHPGYPEALAAAWSAGAAHDVLDGVGAPFDPAALAAVRRLLIAPAIGAPAAAAPPTADDGAVPSSATGSGSASQPPAAADPWTAEPAGAWRAGLIRLLGSWGPAAADAVPEIVAALHDHPDVAVPALAAIGPAASPAVPLLTTLAVGGDIRAGHAVLELTGEADPLVAAAAAILPGDVVTDSPGGRSAAGSPARAIEPLRLTHYLGLIADAGTAAAPLLPALTRLLTGTAADDHWPRRAQVAAARAVWRATGDAEPVLSTLRAVIRRGFAPAGAAARLLAELGEGRDLLPELRKLLNAEPDARIGAALALHRHGVPAEELAGPLTRAVPAGAETAEQALAALVAIGAVSAVPALMTLADRDERFPAPLFADESWADDSLRRRIRATITTLTPATGPGDGSRTSPGASRHS
jgi:hypothetical protein